MAVETSPDVIVLGGGLGGLSSSIVLASRGYDVVLFEAAKTLGGKAGTVVLDGVELDTGPSLLTLPRVFDDVFREAGSSLRDELELVEFEDTFNYHWPDGCELRFHTDFGVKLERIHRTLGSQAQIEFELMASRCRAIWENASPHFLFAPKPTLGTLRKIGLKALGSLPRIDLARSMASAISDTVTNPYLRDIFLRYATYNGSDPRRAPGTLLCIAHVEMAQTLHPKETHAPSVPDLGCFGIKGGIHELVRALERTALRVGVEIRRNTAVDRVLWNGKRVAGVQLMTGERIQSKAVVSNADVNALRTRLLPGAGARRSLHKAPLKGQSPSTSGFNVIFRVARGSSKAPHTVLFPKRYESEFEDLFDYRQPPREPAVYLCAPERAHKRTGWPSDEPLFAMVNAPAVTSPLASKRLEWNTERQRLVSYMVERMARAGIEANKTAAVWERTPIELAERFPASGGSLYGLSSNSVWSAFSRPDNRSSRYPGLYIASGSAHPGGGMPLAVLSGLHASRAADDDFSKAHKTRRKKA